MKNWEEKPISQLGKIVTGKTPPKSEPDYWDGDELFVSPKDMERDSFYIWDTQANITRKALDKFKSQRLPKNAVMYTSLSYGFGKIGVASKDLITNQQITSVISNDENNFRFIYYLLRVNTPYIFSYNSGIDTPIVPKSVFEKIKLLLPPLPIQQKIAAVLSAYDDLIENNNRRIAILEKMAEELYREWFVRLRFPGHEKVQVVKGVPGGWGVQKLPKVADITYGKPFDGSRFNANGIGKPIVRIRNIPSSSTSDYTDEYADDKYLIKKGDLLVGMDGEFHINHWYSEDAYLVQRSCRISAKEPRLEGYLAKAVYAPVKYYEAILQGATVGHLGAKHLNSIDILIPPKSINLEIFNKLLEQKVKYASERNLLKTTRDRLLSRLMSGKIDVENLDIQFPESMQEEVANA